MTRFYMARCIRCGTVVPFWTKADRSEWVDLHSESIDLPGERHDHIVVWEEDR